MIDFETVFLKPEEFSFAFGLCRLFVDFLFDTVRVTWLIWPVFVFFSSKTLTEGESSNFLFEIFAGF